MESTDTLNQLAFEEMKVPERKGFRPLAATLIIGGDGEGVFHQWFFPETMIHGPFKRRITRIVLVNIIDIKMNAFDLIR